MHGGVYADQDRGYGESEIVGSAAVIGLGHSHGGDSGAEKAGVGGAKLVRDASDIEEVRANELADLIAGNAQRTPNDSGDLSDAVILPAGSECGLAYHSGGPGEEDMHVAILPGWSGMVVAVPCSKVKSTNAV